MDATYKTCKLALPLFFLVVKTNVGYSVIAEFIIQHEDTSSIAEALGLLKETWDREGIKVRNFMIDCQQSEENAICGMFPESCVYLCGFHRLQVWLRWLVNTKNGVSGHKDQVLNLLCNIAEATTEEKYTGALLRLQKSYVWSKHAKLRNYYTQQWAPKKLVRNLVNVKVKFYAPYFEINGFANVSFATDVGTGLPCGQAALRQHEQWHRGAEQDVQVFFSKLLPEHDDVKITLYSSRCFRSCAEL